MKKSMLCLMVGCFWHPYLPAATIKELDSSKQYRLKEVQIAGNKAFSARALGKEILTKSRAFYLFWRKPPLFDPVVFETDVKRLRRFYEEHGYYGARVGYELEIDDEALITARIQIAEGQPVKVQDITVEIRRDKPPDRIPGLPLKPGAIFTEDAYQQSEAALRAYYLDRGHAHVETQREAKIDPRERQAWVDYRVKPGPRAVFGETRVQGTERVSPELIVRELTYQRGDRFSLGQIKVSREKIVNLGLFRSVQLVPEETKKDARMVPMRVRVEEQAPRDIRIGVGYGTEDEFRGQVQWAHRNWLGGGRQLSVNLKGSAITRELDASFIQPHFLTPHTLGAVNLALGQEDEETFLLNFSRLRPRLEHRFSPTLSGFIGYRLEYNKLEEVANATAQALGGIKEKGFLSGPTLGVVWNVTDDLLNPKKGGIVTLVGEQAGEPWGGDFRFFKLSAEGKKYQQVGWDIVLAARLKIGIADSLGADDDFPLFERFYAGGEKSVRGYGRRRLGPLGAADDPIGGLSLVEGSIELRRPLWRDLSGAVFLDFGQVATRAYDLPFNELEFSTGFGVSYLTPLGPLRLDLGFPFNPPPGDAAWQVHFSIGQFF
ncbi:MAG: outer membrane protein assembly factor BamA [Gammaproteobacteria bacterium]